MTAHPTPTHDLAVLIGRFQPFHNGHLSLLKQALDAAPRVVVVIGSAFQARSPKNPFSWQERAEMIRLALPEADRQRVLFVPMRDHFDDERWFAEVRQEVDAALSAQGAAPGASSTGWSATSRTPRATTCTASKAGRCKRWSACTPRARSAVRAAIFAARRTHREALARAVPASTLAFLRAWMARAAASTPLAQEWELLRQHDASWAAAPYPSVLVTVDCVVKCRDHVLLIRRGQAPGKGLFAVPGGFLEQRETTLQSALRELEEETHLALPPAALLACLAAPTSSTSPTAASAAAPSRTAISSIWAIANCRRCARTTMPSAVEWTPIGASVRARRPVPGRPLPDARSLPGAAAAAGPLA